MPHLGRHNLSESALFTALGHHRREHLQELGGVRSAGHSRRSTSLRSISRRTGRCPTAGRTTGSSSLRTWSTTSGRTSTAVTRWPASRKQWIRASNVFIYQEQGPSKLSLSTPETVDFSCIPELESAPDSLALCREARLAGGLLRERAKHRPASGVADGPRPRVQEGRRRQGGRPGVRRQGPALLRRKGDAGVVVPEDRGSSARVRWRGMAAAASVRARVKRS